MEREKILEIVKDVENKSNKDLTACLGALHEEYEKTKAIIVDLTYHMDKLEGLFGQVSREIEKRTLK